MVNNGNGWIIRTLVGFLFTIIFFAITFIGKSVVANDISSRTRDEKQVEELSAVKADIREVKTRLGYIEEKQDTVRVEQKEGFAKLEQMINNIHR